MQLRPCSALNLIQTHTFVVPCSGPPLWSLRVAPPNYISTMTSACIEVWLELAACQLISVAWFFLVVNVTDVMHVLVLHHIGPVSYCIEWAMWGPHIKKKLMWGIAIALIHQCDAMHNNLGVFPIFLVCITFQCNASVLFKPALLKQCNANTRQFITSYCTRFQWRFRCHFKFQSQCHRFHPNSSALPQAAHLILSDPWRCILCFQQLLWHSIKPSTMGLQSTYTKIESDSSTGTITICHKL
jgi:hypothetical protein